MPNSIPTKHRLEHDFKNSVPLEGRDVVEEIFTKLVEMSGLGLDFEVKWGEKAVLFLSDRSKCNWETLDSILISVPSKNKRIQIRNEKYLNPWPMMDLLNEILEERKSDKRFYLTTGLGECIVLAAKSELKSFLKSGKSLAKRF